MRLEGPASPRVEQDRPVTGGTTIPDVCIHHASLSGVVHYSESQRTIVRVQLSGSR